MLRIFKKDRFSFRYPENVGGFSLAQRTAVLSGRMDLLAHPAAGSRSFRTSELQTP
jgi:hypothetical protein